MPRGGKKGLTDGQRTAIGFVTVALLAVIAYMATLSEPDRPPSYIYAILGGVAVVAQIAKDQLGIKEAAVSVKAKAVDTRITDIDKKFGDIGKDDVASNPVV